jgi:hypothetical protein
MPFCHLTQYCRSNTAVDIARIIKVSTSSVGIKYNLGIQIPKGIKNEIDLDKNNGLSDIHSTTLSGGYSDRLSENYIPNGF